MRRFRALAVLSLLAGFIALNASAVHATPLNILSTTYTVNGIAVEFYGGPILFEESKSSSSPVEIESNDGPLLKASADGVTGQASGFLSALVVVLGGSGSASADASMDFSPTDSIILNLSAAGSGTGGTLSFLQLMNLTDGTTLLGWSSQFDQTEFFTFLLNPSNQYRLLVHADTPSPDVAAMRVDYSVVPVAEPSGVWLLLIGTTVVLLCRASSPERNRA